MKSWRILLIALLFSLTTPVHASSLMDRVAYIEHELGIVPEEGSNIINRLCAIEEYAGIESSSKSVMDRVADIEQFLGKSLSVFSTKKGISVSTVNIRSGPGFDYEVIGVLSEGDTVEITDKEDSWYHIIFNTLDGYSLEGYVGNIWIDLMEDDTSSIANTLAFELSDGTQILTQDNVASASVDVQTDLSGKNSFIVLITFDEEGKAAFAKATSENLYGTINILVNGEIVSAPTVREPITDGKCVIVGNFTQEEAEELAKMLNQS